MNGAELEWVAANEMLKSIHGMETFSRMQVTYSDEDNRRT